MSGASFLASAIEFESHSGAAGGHEIVIFLEKVPVELVPVTPKLLHVRVEIFGDSARATALESLNFRNCFAYALAEANGELFCSKGDFALTDVRIAIC